MGGIEDGVGIGTDNGVLPIVLDEKSKKAMDDWTRERIKRGIAAPGEAPGVYTLVATYNSIDRYRRLGNDLAKRGWSTGRLEKLFGANFANVQPHSGASANVAAFMALMQPGDTFMGLNLAAGGHLTHGSPVNYSGKWFKVVPYGVRRDDHRIDMEEVRKLAQEHRPKVIVTGGSAYPRIIDFKAFREIADSVGAKLKVGRQLAYGTQR